jgi:hypothetical protein
MDLLETLGIVTPLTPQRRAASAPVISLANTANTNRVFSSAAIFVRRDRDISTLFSASGRAHPQLATLPKSLSQWRGI